MVSAIETKVCNGIARGAAVSERAYRALDVLKRLGATSPERAISDCNISREARVPQRDVIDLAEELVEIDVAVLATCGKGREGRRGKGRFICAHPGMVREYAEKLDSRAKKILVRAAKFRKLAERLDARRFPVDSERQRRLFA